jgi:hypothetical protein
VRDLILDEMLPAGLEEELRARGRPARRLEPAGLTDPEALDAARDGVLVTADQATADGRPAGSTVALVVARAGPPRRDAVHRHAHEMSAQRPGSLRRYVG